MQISDLYAIYLQNPKLSTDSRTIQGGELFFALTGENFNGNQYAQQALQKGAAYAVIDQAQYQSEKTILVKNVLETLQNLATYHRKKLNAKVFALTGSNGKTTTKELIREVLATSFRIHATKGNLNNHIGVPLTLLAAPLDTEILVVEMGANQPKDIAQLCEIARPDLGVITNIGYAHLEGLGGLEGVLREKTALYRFLDAHGGTILLPSYSQALMSVEKLYKEKIFYGNQDEFSYAQLLETAPFVCYQDQYGNQVKTQITGKYNFDNIQTALCVGKFFGIEAQKANQAIAQYSPSNNRSQVIHKKNTIILDAYNANPSSMQAAIENFAELVAAHKVLILGDMFELGEVAAQKHEQILRLAQSLSGVLRIFCGKNFYTFAHHADEQTFFFEQKNQLAQWLQKQAWTERHILIKASRGMSLETLLDVLA